MIKPSAIAIIVILVATSLVAAPPQFQQIVDRYEAVRVGLVADSDAVVASEATKIVALATAAQSRFDAQKFGVKSENAAAAAKLLPQITATAKALAKSTNIAGARAAFGALSAQMVDMHRLAPASKSAIAYCSMAKKQWLQPKDIIGNPYYGQSMARCGEFIN